MRAIVAARARVHLPHPRNNLVPTRARRHARHHANSNHDDSHVTAFATLNIFASAHLFERWDIIAPLWSKRSDVTFAMSVPQTADKESQLSLPGSRRDMPEAS